MLRLSPLLCICLISVARAVYVIEMAVSLNGLADLTTPQRLSFRTAVATTAVVSVDAVSIVSVTAAAGRRRLFSASVRVDFEITTLDYATASDVGVRLRASYLSKDLNDNGLPVAAIVSGPSFRGHDYEMLTCGGCPDGQYLDGTCQECPEFSRVPPRVNAPDRSFCACEPGYTESGSLCTPCGFGFYKPQVSNATCTSCPANSSTAVDTAVDAAECLCLPGFYHDGNACIECGTGSFDSSLGNEACAGCAPNSTLVANSAGQYFCACDLGFTGPYGGPCQACAVGKYGSSTETSICVDCDAGKYNELDAATSVEFCIECPQNTSSSPGSGSSLACVCNAGFAAVRANADAAWTCNACEAGFYAVDTNSSYCTPCGPGTYSIATAAASADVCTECGDGYYSMDTGASECTLCPPNTWQNTSSAAAKSTLCEPCPAHSNHSVLGSTDVNDCVCSTGLYAVVDAGLSTCENCPPDSFCPGNNLYEPCPENSDTGGIEGSSTSTDCVCSAGYVGPDGGPCELCPVGRYCPGGDGTQPCRLHSNSSTGAKTPEECTCNPGYVSTTGGACMKCPPNSYCPGGEVENPCPGNSSSVPGSSNITQCWCNEGTWRGCIITADGDTLDGDGVPCTIDYTLACFDCDANDICVNNTMEHCMEHAVAPAGSHEIEACVCVDGYYNVNSP